MGAHKGAHHGITGEYVRQTVDHITPELPSPKLKSRRRTNRTRCQKKFPKGRNVDPYVVAPSGKGICRDGFDRLLSYVRPLGAVAHDRGPRWFPRREFQTDKRPLMATDSNGLSRVSDRSITPPVRSLASSSLNSARYRHPYSPRLSELYTAIAAEGATDREW
ncbi:hypothetical protein EBBID32_26620 [Sphingobium indicum BiD32]|uniref:Uncharacterized protein n=1 Tax=Sphingobium indicum BiD32 TaxID=1301087 RepID=N1MMY3_9SPHN|nr:hypothetical protein EBBID32_26620 [Sphingobium indicum BiD32]